MPGEEVASQGNYPELNHGRTFPEDALDLLKNTPLLFDEALESDIPDTYRLNPGSPEHLALLNFLSEELSQLPKDGGDSNTVLFRKDSPVVVDRLVNFLGNQIQSLGGAEGWQERKVTELEDVAQTSASLEVLKTIIKKNQPGGVAYSLELGASSTASGNKALYSIVLDRYYLESRNGELYGETNGKIILNLISGQMTIDLGRSELKASHIKDL